MSFISPQTPRLTFDLSTGVLRVSLADMDRETRENYSVVIQAKDMGGQMGGLAGTTTVNITLTDINDNPPMFDQSKRASARPRRLIAPNVARFLKHFPRPPSPNSGHLPLISAGVKRRERKRPPCRTSICLFDRCGCSLRIPRFKTDSRLARVDGAPELFTVTPTPVRPPPRRSGAPLPWHVFHIISCTPPPPAAATSGPMLPLSLSTFLHAITGYRRSGVA